MKRRSVGGVLGIIGSALLLTGACGGSAFTSGAGADAGGSGLGKAGSTSSSGATGESGSTSSGGSSSGGTSSGGTVSSGGTTSGGAGGSISGAGAAGKGAGGSVSGAGAGGKGSGGAAGSMSGAGAGGVIGSAGSAGAGGGSCVGAMLTFKMVPAVGTPASAYCTASCNANWLTITDSHSNVVALDRACNVPDCKTCAATACPPVACLIQAIPVDGLSRAWNEVQWNPNTCGAMSNACAIDQCSLPGKYKAKMCAAKNTMPGGNFCSPDTTPVCTTVDFELPGATVVQGTIGG